MCSPGVSDGEESACNAGDLGLIPGLERYPGEGNGRSVAWRIPRAEEGGWVHGVTKSLAGLSG